MKKTRILSLLPAVVLALALTACGGDSQPAASGGGSQHAVSGELQTIGDALTVETEYNYASWDDSNYVYVFDNNGTPTRVVAELNRELREQIDDALFSDGGGDEAVKALLAPLPLVSVEDLSAGIPDQSELDALVGKTGQELLDDGYEIWGSSVDDTGVSFTLVKGLYEFEVAFQDAPSAVDTKDPDGSMPGLTVSGVTYHGISSNATDLSLTP